MGNTWWEESKREAIAIVSKLLNTEHATEMQILLKCNTDEPIRVGYKIEQIAVPESEVSNVKTE